jgi:hypothetical protein
VVPSQVPARLKTFSGLEPSAGKGSLLQGLEDFPNLVEGGVIVSVDSWIQLVMLVVVGWYACQTYLMQKAMVNQNKLQTRNLEFQIRPILAVEAGVDSDKRTLLHVSNRGIGPAINLKVDPILVLDKEHGPNGLEVRLEFADVIPVLATGKTEQLVATTCHNGNREADSWPWGYGLDKRSTKVYPVTLHFLDVEGVQRHQTFELGLGQGQLSA